ncbi:MAG: hypothetical protein ACXWT4_17465 [Methylobacter sp.]
MTIDTDKAIERAKTQAAYLGTGAAVGAVSHKALTAGSPGHPNTAMQIGSAMGAAATGGAGVSGTVAAGVGVVTAKVTAVTVAATAAAPFVLGAAAVGALGYGLYKLFADD